MLDMGNIGWGPNPACVTSSEHDLTKTGRRGGIIMGTPLEPYYQLCLGIVSEILASGIKGHVFIPVGHVRTPTAPASWFFSYSIVYLVRN